MKYISKLEVCEKLGLSPNTIDKMERKGMPVRRIPDMNPLYVIEECLEWIERYRKGDN